MSAVAIVLKSSQKMIRNKIVSYVFKKRNRGHPTQETEEKEIFKKCVHDLIDVGYLKIRQEPVKRKGNKKKHRIFQVPQGRNTGNNTLEQVIMLILSM